MSSKDLTVLPAHLHVHLQSELATPAFAFSTIAGIHLPTLEGWKAELAWVAGYVNLGYPVFIEAKDDGGGGDNWTTGAISFAKLQSNHHHQQTNIQFFHRPDALRVAQPTVLKH